MMKSCFVLWSAGVDSTYLILRLLENGYEVHAGYIDIQNNSKKTKMELDAISKLHPQISERFSHFKYHGTVYRARNNCAGLSGTRGLRYRQVPYFLHAFVAVPQTDFRAIGYVKGDSAIKNLEKIRAVYNTYNLICFKVLPKLVFPLKNISKFEIFKYMNEKYENILSNCVWCEAPIGEHFAPCNECTPCLRRANEIRITSNLMEAS